MIEEDKLKRNTPPPSSSSRLPTSDEHGPGYYEPPDVQEKQGQGNQEKLHPFDAAQEAATESLLRVRQAAADIRVMNHSRRLYHDRAHLVPGIPNRLSNIVRVEERFAAIERSQQLLNWPLSLLERETQLYHYGGMAVTGADTRRRLATLGLRESDIPSPYSLYCTNR
jgi:hypothetical protein